MNDEPLLALGLLAAALYVAWLWRGDWLAWKAGRPNPKGFPGATSAPSRALVYAVGGALVLLGAEVAGEYALGLVDDQSTMNLAFAAYSVLGAAFIEELIFRGYLLFDRRGPGLLWVGILAASALFALLHPFLWDWQDGTLVFQFTPKAWFSTGAIFASSLWFYAVRVASWNPNRSLLPCIAAHAAKNLGVVLVKAAQGFLVLG